MQYRVRLNPEIQADVAHFSPNLKKKIKSALKALQINPSLGKLLVDELEGFWSYPVSHHRVIYVIQGKTKEVQIVMIAPREEVYELLLSKITA